MDIDSFLALAKKRRSMRRFKPAPIPDEDIKKILESARWAMSGANSQPWEFIIIKDPKTKEKLGKAYLWFAEASTKVEATRLPEYSHTKYADAINITLENQAQWTLAPVIIAVLGDPRTLQASTLMSRFFDEPTFVCNLANTTLMIHLAAASLGLGAEWVTIVQPVSEMMKPILGIPPVLRLFTLVPLGYPARQPVPFRRELNEMVHYEKYDMAKYRSQDDIQEFIKYLRGKHKENGSYPQSDPRTNKI